MHVYEIIYIIAFLIIYKMATLDKPSNKIIFQQQEDDQQQYYDVQSAQHSPARIYSQKQNQQQPQKRQNQIITNLIKVKSIPKLQSRTRRRQKRHTEQADSHKQNIIEGTQMKGKDYLDYNGSDGQKSQTTSNKETKPGKTLQEPEYEEGLSNIHIQDFEDESNFEYKRHRTSESDVKVVMPVSRRSHELSERGSQAKGEQINQKHQKQKKQDEDQYKQQKWGIQSNDQEQDEEYDEEQQYQEYKIQQKIKTLKDQQRRSKQMQRKRNPSIQINFTKQKLQQFIHTPLRCGYQMQCIITKQSGFLGMSTKYHLKQKYQTKILLSAKKQIMSLNPKFILSLNRQNHSRRHHDYVGVMKSSFGGRCWKLNCPVVPSKFNQGQISSDQTNILNVEYISSVLGSKSIRQMEIFFKDPELNQEQKYKIDLQKRIKTTKKKNLVRLTTKKPIFVKGRYQLDFQGLAKMPSNKNFMLQTDKGQVCLIFAKQGEDIYQMNVRFPLTLIQGFSICLASLDSKLFVN